MSAIKKIVIIVLFVCFLLLFSFSFIFYSHSLSMNVEPTQKSWSIEARGNVTSISSDELRIRLGTLVGYEYTIELNGSTTIQYRRFIVPEIVAPWSVGDMIYVVKMVGFTMPEVIENEYSDGTYLPRHDGVISESQLDIVNSTCIALNEERDEWIANKPAHDEAMAIANGWFVFMIVLMIVLIMLCCGTVISLGM
jgi:hypothetical protein